MRQSKQARIEELERTLAIEQKGIIERDGVIERLKLKLSYAERTERRFDQLMEGLCMGMREGNLPRRPA